MVMAAVGLPEKYGSGYGQNIAECNSGVDRYRSTLVSTFNALKIMK